ncbi:DNA polymerase III subunit alpha [Arthrobacter crystallopoietes]|uniref:DNA polymerase III subunit alpha n=1 Tax=Crystallibacter crystallopoietes TaxID=37928 RepID=A0A1H1GD83_9MICC|nr:DNA polymerase III subunit alpha [Arthrobacter crystallopoietes]AUI52631.1 DNA polymerase III subunit alpha [Arthrobacter crystallopoietes]SDR11170.1 DNA polymerase III, alpha subunit [Arthrobacter crystallopoietes]
MSFTHLHVSSAFSAHYGVSWPDELVAAAADDGADALACTDRDGLYGTVKHVKACLAAGIDPIVGVDLALHGSQGQSTGRVVVLAHGHNNGRGYHALCRLISDAHEGTASGRGAKGREPGVGIVQIAHRATGSPESSDAGSPAVLTVLLGPYSDVGQALRHRRYAEARRLAGRWRSIMPAGSLVLEVVNHLSPPGDNLSTAHAVRMLKLAADLDLPAVLTNAARYRQVDDAATADVLDSVRALTALAKLPDLQPNGQGWLKSSAQMQVLAYETAQEAGTGRAGAGELLAMTETVADRCRMDPYQDMGYKNPVVPEASVIGIGQDPVTELIQRCETGITARFPGISGKAEHELRDRLAHELGIITRLGFASYFLTVAEVSKIITDMGVRASARGSGASSLVNYLLYISHVNPLAHGLIFERFLSRDRSTLPDIDIDVESAERHNVYRQIFERFGDRRVTLMSMQNGYRARGAVRDAGLALGMEEEDISGIAKQLWRFSARKFREAMEEKPELRDFSAQVEQNKQLDLLVDVTERLDRLPRHISMHPCGVILGDESLLDRTPVQPSGLGLPMSQFDKHDMDPMGMLKLDVLGVRMQSSMAYAVNEIVRIHSGKAAVTAAGNHPVDAGGNGPGYIAEDGRINLEAVPLDDEETFELIRSTHTLGCFQIESPGQRELVGKMAPRNFNDLIIDISLFRPGPMKSDMVRPFLEQRHGWAPENYPHADLETVLKETHGVTVFHEQVLRTFDVFTGCGLARADEFRRLLGDEGAEPTVEEYFRRQAMERGYSMDTIDKIWSTLKAFGSFGFCKAHGAAFAVPTYQSAWLKAHHPEAFLAGLWEHDPGMYPRRLLVAEARRMGIPILPLDINRSADMYRVERMPAANGEPEKLGIRLSLAGIYGLSAAELKRIVAGQPYDSLADLRARAKVSRPTLKRLAKLGAFDELNHLAGRKGTSTRADLVHHLDKPPVRPVPRRYEPIDGQLSFPLGDLELSNLKTCLPEPTMLEKVRTELDLLAVDVSAHLMDSYAPLLKELKVTAAKDLLSLRNGTQVLVAGIRVATQTPPMRGGRRVVFISVDDGTGCVDCTFFHEAQDKAGPLLFGTRLLLIQGLTRRTGPRGMSLQATDAWDLSRPETLPLVRPAETPVSAHEQPHLQLPDRAMLVGLNISG